MTITSESSASNHARDHETVGAHCGKPHLSYEGLVTKHDVT